MIPKTAEDKITIRLSVFCATISLLNTIPAYFNRDLFWSFTWMLLGYCFLIESINIPERRKK